MNEDRTLTLLAVTAHPDDEVFRCGGTLALLVRRGVRVHLLTATRGDKGARGDPPLCTPEQLGAVREAELRCSCRKLGIEPPHLLDYRDGALSDVDDVAGADHVRAMIHRLHPQILLTWPPHGLSGHPDHVAVSRWTTQAFAQEKTPISLYHLCVPDAVAQAVGFPRLHTVPTDQIAVTVDVEPVWAQKMTAIRCHRTQRNASPILSADEQRKRIFLGQEHFTRFRARSDQDFLLDLFSRQRTFDDKKDFI